ncbi:MAG: hypothetical protein WAM17_01515 [Rhodoplanes sp.]
MSASIILHRCRRDHRPMARSELGPSDLREGAMRGAPELIAWFESLTTPQSEDWQIVLAGKTAHVAAIHEDRSPMGRALVNMALFEVPIDELKRRVKEYPVNQPRGGRPLGCVSVVICRDDFERGNYLANWFANQARKRNFSVIRFLP